jgi:hypothetical protein
MAERRHGQEQPEGRRKTANSPEQSKIASATPCGAAPAAWLASLWPVSLREFFQEKAPAPRVNEPREEHSMLRAGSRKKKEEGQPIGQERPAHGQGKRTD